jgi:hypothetical protein
MAEILPSHVRECVTALESKVESAFCLVVTVAETHPGGIERRLCDRCLEPPLAGPGQFPATGAGDSPSWAASTTAVRAVPMLTVSQRAGPRREMARVPALRGDDGESCPHGTGRG